MCVCVCVCVCVSVCVMYYHHPLSITSSFPRADQPNSCTEAVIDHSVRTWKSPRWTKPRSNQSASFLPVSGRSIRALRKAYSYSHAEGQSSMDIEWITEFYAVNQPRPPNILAGYGTLGTTIYLLYIFIYLIFCLPQTQQKSHRTLHPLRFLRVRKDRTRNP